MNVGIDTLSLAERLIDYAQDSGRSVGVDSVRIHAENTHTHDIQFEAGTLSRRVAGIASNAEITLHAGAKSLSISRQPFANEAALKVAIDQALQALPYVPDNPYGHLLEAEYVYKGPHVDLDLKDKNPPTEDQLFSYIRAMQEGAEEGNSHIVIETIGMTTQATQAVTLATNGVRVLTEDTSYTSYISVVVGEEPDRQTDSEVSIARHFSDMADPRLVGQTAARKAYGLLGARVPDTQNNVPVILSPDAASDFFEVVFEALDADSVYREETIWKDKLGHRVMHNGVTIIDKPEIPRGHDSAFIDSAGMKQSDIVFIENGILKSYNASVMEARQLDIEPIGREDGQTNVMVLPGKKSLEQLMSDIDEGIYVKGFAGGEADVNTDIFSREAWGREIRNGQLTGQALKGFVVSGKLNRMFRTVVLGNDTPKLPNTRTSFVAPTARLKGMTISGQ